MPGSDPQRSPWRAFLDGLLGKSDDTAQSPARSQQRAVTPVPRSKTAAAPSLQPQTPEELARAGVLWDHGLDLDEQIEVAGETYHTKAIRRVFKDAGMPITQRGSTLESVVACLVPEPWNPHDSNAVAVCCAGHHVGYIPAEMAPDYCSRLIAIAQRNQLVSGTARIWAKSDSGVLRARVTLLVPEAEALN